jgi:hypothetical protein
MLAALSSLFALKAAEALWASSVLQGSLGSKLLARTVEGVALGAD